MNIKKDIVVRVRLAFVLVLIFGVLIVVKIGKIQILDGEKWKEKAKNLSLSEKNVSATRGNIYSDNGSLLATSLPFFRIAFDPTVLADEQEFDDNIDSLAYQLSVFFGTNSKNHYKHLIKNARAKKKRYIRIGDRLINYHEKKMITQFPIFRKGKYKGGVIFEKIDRRFKPFNHLASRTIGFINSEEDSLQNLRYFGAGLEYSYNKQLAGIDGHALFQKIAGTWVPIINGEKTEPVNGYDVVTTIDINIQDVAENALLAAVEKYQAEYGTVILMEVQTGEIKAIANLGRSKNGQYYEMYNYGVGSQGLTEPGSTFKLASMIALFENNKNLKLTDSVDTENGKYKFYNSYMTDSKPEGYGKITVQEVFEKSSNIGVSKLVDNAFKKNPQSYINYLYEMGMNDSLGFQIDGEAKPYIKTPKDKSWSGISLPWMSIGYELKIAPIHTLAFYNAIANNGIKIEPIIVKETKIADKTIEQYQPRILNEKICSDKTLEKVKKMLEGVVENGTAKNIKSKNYKIAGKTGTSQKLQNGVYIRKYSTSFVGYFPANNPKYSCIVVIDSPKGFNTEGSNVAAPVFKEIADKIYARNIVLQKPIELKPKLESGVFPTIKGGNQEDLRYLCNKLGISTHSNNSSELIETKVRNNAIYFQSKKMVEGLVPNVIGFRLKDALYALENEGLKVRIKGEGRVVAQSQNPGVKSLRNSEIIITLQ